MKRLMFALLTALLGIAAYRAVQWLDDIESEGEWWEVMYP